jgi:hypothetical protein
LREVIAFGSSITGWHYSLLYLFTFITSCDKGRFWHRNRILGRMNKMKYFGQFKNLNIYERGAGGFT